MLVRFIHVAPLCRERESRLTIRIVEWNDALNVAGRIENVNLG